MVTSQKTRILCTTAVETSGPPRTLLLEVKMKAAEVLFHMEVACFKYIKKDSIEVIFLYDVCTVNTYM
jgi:hypothetical protein